MTARAPATAINPKTYRDLIKSALAEDLGSEGDVTTAAIFADEQGSARLTSKDSGVAAGLEIFAAVFKEIDPATTVEFKLTDGEPLEPGDVVAIVRGKAASLLAAERVALNFVSYLSGIATAARKLSGAAARGGTKILDTRKTLPGYRELAKYAVRVGGAENHRMGLFDMVLIKDNHIDLAGSIATAVRRVHIKWGDRFKIEVECRSLIEVAEALEAKVEMIMLDNMQPRDIRRAVKLIGGRAKVELSGNMDLASAKRLAGPGVDYISVGSLTHSVRSFDFSLKVEAI